MTPTEVALLLGYGVQLDARLVPSADDPEERNAAVAIKAGVWAETLAPDLTFDYARAAVRAHYASLSTSITPALINAAWYSYQRQAGAPLVGAEAHCGRATCRCDHSSPCYKGWVDRDTEGAPMSVAPCRVCRPTLHQRLQNMPPPGQRSDGDMARLRSVER